MSKEVSTPRLIRLKELVGMVGLTRSTIYRRIAAGTFPQQIPLGCRVVVWNEKEVNEWIKNQISPD